MIAYYGYTISPNQIETVEGFLICRNVPIARVGEMKYLESEMVPGGDRSKMVKVCRSPDEVFSDAALSSFEGKPVTDDHPPESLTPDNYGLYVKGHAQNIRKGTGEWEGHMIADLHIQDEGLIQAVQDGKREISCGYSCSYTDNGDGTYSQHDIRGNHIAVVTRGRAGKQVAILDSGQAVAERPERKRNMKNSLLLKLFAKAAKDASPEELENLAADAADAFGEEPGKKTPPAAEPAKEPAKEPPKKEAAEDACTTDSKLDALMEMLTKMMGSQAESEPSEDPLDSLIKGLEGETADSGEEAKVIPAEEKEKEKTTDAADKAVMVEAIKKMRPAIASIKDSADRKKVTDSLISWITDNDSVNDIAKIMQATQKNAAKMADQKPGIDLDACQAAYDAMNPHKNGGKK